MSPRGVTGRQGHRRAEPGRGGGTGREPLRAIRTQLSGDAAPAHDLPAGVQRDCRGTASRLHVPAASVRLAAVDRSARFAVSGATELADEPYLLWATHDEGPDTVLALSGPASCRPTEDGVAVSFWTASPVAAGREPTDGGRATVTVDPTPAGVATALSHLSVAHRTDAPARSHPRFRDRPPAIECGERTAVPEALRRRRPDSDLTLTVPRSLAATFVAAPLAHYLGASVAVADVERPRLVAESAAVDHAFSPLPAFQSEVGDLLARVFWLDCAVRSVATDPETSRSVPLDAAALRSATPAERLERYLDVPDDAVAAFPDWHLTTHVRPAPETVACLPHLLDRLSLIALPEAARLRGRDLLDETLRSGACEQGGWDSMAAATRGSAREGAGEGLLKPVPTAGRVSAWLAPGSPIGAFKPTPRAYANRERFRARRTDRRRIAVVLNDDAMADERAAVADVYADRAEQLPLAVTVHEGLTRAALADLLEADHDLVHYIGHCEDGGLRCPDGTLDVADLADVRARTFFLNACESYEQGLALLDGGAVAGAVTYRSVLDDHAATVGAAFARLAVSGLTVGRALALARRRILTGTDYVVVGDGTATPLADTGRAAFLRVSPDGDGYRVVCDACTARTAGVRHEVPGFDDPIPNGGRAERRVDTAQLRSLLADASCPVIFEGEVCFPSAVRSRL